MLHPIVLCFLFLAYHVQSEVSQQSPVQQSIQSPGVNDSALEGLAKMASDYENLTIEILNAPKLNPNEDYLKDTCEKNNKSEKYEGALASVKNFKTCFSNILPWAQIPYKIQKSKPSGELDTVFKEYCAEIEKMKGCVHYFLLGIVPCLAGREIKARYTAEKMSETVLDFVCENEGDHIALFISEKGPDCILSKQEGIKKCIHDHYHDPKTNPAFWADGKDVLAGKFNFSNEKDVQIAEKLELGTCRMMHKIRKCIVNELTTCAGSTPANVVDSIFNLIYNESTCAQYKMQDIDPEFSGGVSLFTSLFSVIIPALTVLLVRTFNS